MGAGVNLHQRALAAALIEQLADEGIFVGIMDRPDGALFLNGPRRKVLAWLPVVESHAQAVGEVVADLERGALAAEAQLPWLKRTAKVA